MGYIGPTRLASFPTDVNNVLTRFAGATVVVGAVGAVGLPSTTVVLQFDAPTRTLEIQ